MSRVTKIARTLALSIIILFFFSSGAYAYCGQPSLYSSLPSPPGSYQKPSLPYCLSDYKYSGKHSCNSWEIDTYIDGINEYIRALENYVAEAYSFAGEASDYANQAAEYARCESENAKSEFE